MPLVKGRVNPSSEQVMSINYAMRHDRLESIDRFTDSNAGTLGLSAARNSSSKDNHCNVHAGVYGLSKEGAVMAVEKQKTLG